MTTAYPLKYRWNGQTMTPLVLSVAEREFKDGETYRLAVCEERSAASHNHYFAAVQEAWNNLPEHLAERFATAEHLRKYGLIKAGYCNENSIVAGSKAEARRIARFVRPLDDYAVVIVREATVSVYTAKSQSARAMGAREFGESKRKVLEMLSGMIGVSQEDLNANAGRAA